MLDPVLLTAIQIMAIKSFGVLLPQKNYMLKFLEMCRMVLSCFKKLQLTTSVTFIRSLTDEEDGRCQRLKLHTVMRATTIWRLEITLLVMNFTPISSLIREGDEGCCCLIPLMIRLKYVAKRLKLLLYYPTKPLNPQLALIPHTDGSEHDAGRGAGGGARKSLDVLVVVFQSTLPLMKVRVVKLGTLTL